MAAIRAEVRRLSALAGPIALTQLSSTLLWTVDLLMVGRVGLADFNAVALGRVTDVDDPDGYGRVRVVLPGHGELDLGWLAVLCPGAGPGKGDTETSLSHFAKCERRSASVKAAT